MSRYVCTTVTTLWIGVSLMCSVLVAKAAGTGSKRDYLAPIELSDFANYRQAWQSKLSITPGAARMVILPSFQPELAVSLDVRVPRQRNASNYYLTLTKASQSIWHSLPDNGGTGGTIMIDRVEVAIGDDIAKAVLRVWHQMLIQAEPEGQSSSIILDGTNVEFSTLLDDGHRLYAQLPDHPGETSQALADLGYALIRYCEAHGQGQHGQDIREKVEKLSRQLKTGLGDTTSERRAQVLSEPIAETYRNLLKEKLLTSPGNFGAMILMPTGRGEWAVSASAVRKGKSKSSFRLSLTLATANLYESTLGTDRKDRDVAIREIPVKIDKKFALAIRRAWRAILSRDSLPQSEEEFAMVLDGYSADFSVKMPDGRVITRRTLSPQAPPAAEIVTLGYDLRDYCLSPVGERKRKRHDIIEKLYRFSEQFERKDTARVESRVLDSDGGRDRVEKISNATRDR